MEDFKLGLVNRTSEELLFPGGIIKKLKHFLKNNAQIKQGDIIKISEAAGQPTDDILIP